MDAHQFVITLLILDGVVEYKYLLLDSNTGSVQWESGYNHKVRTAE